jgi:AraC-like DNA-binding protein
MWTGKAVIRPGWAIFHGTAGDQARHRHHAVQVAIGVQRPVELWAEQSGALAASGVVIAADCAHQLASGPSPLILIYLERESAMGRTLDSWCAGGAKPLSSDQNRELASLLKNPAHIGNETIGHIVTLILGPVPLYEDWTFRDERISHSIAALPHPLPESLTLAEVARNAGLSSSRYAHLFRAHAGMPLRPYLRWLRLQQALAEVARGANLTEAAYAAGFADSAHLSRSFRRTFGVAPNILLQPALSLEAEAPAP